MKIGTLLANLLIVEIDLDTEQNSGDWRLEIDISVLDTEHKKWRLEIGDWRLQIGPLLSSKDMASSTIDDVPPSFRSGRLNVHALVAPQTKNMTQQHRRAP